jgi:hypothetical protein
MPKYPGAGRDRFPADGPRTDSKTRGGGSTLPAREQPATSWQQFKPRLNYIATRPGRPGTSRRVVFIKLPKQLSCAFLHTHDIRCRKLRRHP